MEYAVGARVTYYAAKDVYFVSRWIYRTLKSASHQNEELRELQKQFFDEFSIITSFGYTFLRDPDSLAANPSYRALLPPVTTVFENLQNLYASDAARIAIQDDQQYKTFSKRYNEFLVANGTGSIVEEDISWELEEPPVQALVTAGPSMQQGAPEAMMLTTSVPIESPANIQRQQPIQQQDGQHHTPRHRGLDLRWALRGRPKLEKLLKSIRLQSKELRSIAPLFLGAQIQVNQVQLQNSQVQLQNTLREISQQRDLHHMPGNLGISNHLAIREIAESDTSSSSETTTVMSEAVPKLKDLAFPVNTKVMPTKALGLCQGTITEPRKNPEKVLIEYKKWRLSDDRKHIIET
jgi:hypothetical protein